MFREPISLLGTLPPATAVVGRRTSFCLCKPIGLLRSASPFKAIDWRCTRILNGNTLWMHMLM
jgi:hypothetical protein